MREQDQNSAKMAEQAMGQIGQTRAQVPSAPVPFFTIQATDAQAPELVLAWMQSNFHRLDDATLYQTLGQAIRMRNFYHRPG